HRRCVELKFTVTKIQRHTAESLYQHEVVERTEEPGLSDQRSRYGTHLRGIFDNAIGRVDIGECSTPKDIGAAARRRDFAHTADIHHLEVIICTLCVGGFIRTHKRSVVEIALAEDVAQVRIHGSQPTVYTLFGLEEPGLVNASRFFLQDIGATYQEHRKCKCSRKLLYSKFFHIVLF